MMPIKQMSIGVIGDEDLISGMRLAGISRHYLIEGGANADKEVREVLSKLVKEPDVAVIVLLEDYAEYVDDLLAEIKEGRKMTPVVIEVPSKRGTKYGDTKAYYKAFIRKFIGFDIEI